MPRPCDHPDLYLPCGVVSVAKLRDLVVVEETTLVALARADPAAEDNAARKNLHNAMAARAARLHELRAAAASIVAVGVYYKIRARSAWATYGGVVFGLAGVILIITAVAGSARLSTSRAPGLQLQAARRRQPGWRPSHWHS